MFSGSALTSHSSQRQDLCDVTKGPSHSKCCCIHTLPGEQSTLCVYLIVSAIIKRRSAVSAAAQLAGCTRMTSDDLWRNLYSLEPDPSVTGIKQSDLRRSQFMGGKDSLAQLPPPSVHTFWDGFPVGRSPLAPSADSSAAVLHLLSCRQRLHE